MTEKEIEENRNTLMHNFMDIFTYIEDLEDKFGRFAPVALAYFNALINDYPQSSIDIIKSINNQIPLKLCNGKKVDYKCKGEHIRNYDKKNGQIYQIIHIFTNKNKNLLFYADENKEFLDGDFLSFNAFLENDYSKNKQSQEEKILQYKEKIDEIKVFIHEFSHSIANIKILPYDKKLKKNKNKDLYLVGGIPYYYRDKKTGQIYSNAISAMIHEGCTEFVTQTIFYNPSMQEYINSVYKNPLNQTYHPKVSYKIEYSFVAMCNSLLDNFIIDAYFYDYDTIENKEYKSNFVSETYYPLGKIIAEIEKCEYNISYDKDNLDSLNNKNVVLALSNNLVNETIKIAQALYSLYTIKNKDLEENQKKCFQTEYSYFINSMYWLSPIKKITKKLTSKEQEMFFNNFKEKLENASLSKFDKGSDNTADKMQNLKSIIDNMFSNVNKENKENKENKDEKTDFIL